MKPYSDGIDERLPYKCFTRHKEKLNKKMYSETTPNVSIKLLKQLIIII